MLPVWVLAWANTPRGMLQAPTAAAAPPSTVRRVSRRFVLRDRIAVPPLPGNPVPASLQAACYAPPALYGPAGALEQKRFSPRVPLFLHHLAASRGGRGHAPRRAPLSPPGR